MSRLPRERGPAERPIILSAAQVMSIRDLGTRQHRFVLPSVPAPPSDDVRPGAEIRHPAPYVDAYCSALRTEANPRGASEVWCWWTRDDRAAADFVVPCKPGDSFWVRERWHPVPPGARNPAETRGIAYEADTGAATGIAPAAWRPALTMPRSASRLDLWVWQVRVERLQDVSDADAIASGALRVALATAEPWTEQGKPPLGQGPRERFRHAWILRHAPGSWDDNPWVCVIDFTISPHP